MLKTHDSTRSIGNRAEGLACDYLGQKGYKILKRNYFIRGGELDIVAEFGGYLVFIEVKARYSHEYGRPAESITPWKLKALKKTAQFYIHQNRLHNKACRFHLLAIDYSDDKDRPVIELIEDII